MSDSLSNRLNMKYELDSSVGADESFSVHQLPRRAMTTALNVKPPTNHSRNTIQDFKPLHNNKQQYREEL